MLLHTYTHTLAHMGNTRIHAIYHKYTTHAYKAYERHGEMNIAVTQNVDTHTCMHTHTMQLRPQLTHT